MCRALLSLLMLSLAGCASINVQALDPTGSRAVGPAGLRYYMPRPYLLVTAVPPSTPASGGSASSDGTTPQTGDAIPAAPSQGGPHAAGGSGSGGSGATGSGTGSGSSHDSGTTGTGQANTASQPAATPTSDVSYVHASDQYQVKLVYLPDLSRPMTITQSAGLFGTASSQPTLQDGWMLTSLQGSADNKVAETLTAVASVITALKGPAPSSGGSSNSGGGSRTAGGGGTPTATAVVSSDWVLPPGLYAFDYDSSTGNLTGLCVATRFTSEATVVPVCSGETVHAPNWSATPAPDK